MLGDAGMGIPETAIAGSASAPLSGSGRRTIGLRAAVISLFALGMLACGGSLTAIHFWRVLPFSDQWETVFLYQRWSEQGWLAAGLLKQHNEHRHLWSNLLFLADFEYFYGTSALARAALLVVQFSLGGLIGLLATGGRPMIERAFAVMLAVALLASPLNIDNLILPFHIAIPLVCLLALLAFHFAARAALAPVGHAALYPTLLSCVAILACPFAMANGLIAPVLAVTLTLMLRANRFTTVLIALAATATIVLYLADWSFPPQHRNLVVSQSGLGAVIQIVTHSLALLGAPATWLGSEAAIIGGIIGLALWLRLLIGVFCQVSRCRSIDAPLVSLFSLATFALGTAVLVGLGRSGAGLWQAMSTRYATFSLVFWLAVLGSFWRFGAIADTERAPRLMQRMVLLAVTALVIFAFGVWPREFDRWRRQVNALDGAAANLVAGKFNPGQLAQIYPDPGRLLMAVEYLRRRELSIFARPRQ